MRVWGKCGKERLAPISFDLRVRLFRWLQHHKGDLLFGTRNGTRVTVRNFQRNFRRLCQRAGIDHCSPHTLRHTFAVAYLRAGGNIYYLSKILGHTSVKTTERHLQSLGTDDLRAVHDRLSPLCLTR